MAHVVTLTRKNRHRSLIEVGICFTRLFKGGFYFAPILKLVRIQTSAPMCDTAN